jgi:hypothetical protein
MMQYLLLIYDSERRRAAESAAERDALTAAYMQVVAELTAEGTYLGGNPLQPTATASSVRVREGKVHVVDGPFAETREQLGGYFLVEAADDEAARAIAARLPTAKVGTIEVRRLQSHNR